jgi:RNA 2',3'-cyclic 3'-phosphodiesterase
MARRVFIAAGISKDLKQDIYDHTSRAFPDHDNIRIIPPENLHITLKFIGYAGDRMIEEIKRITGEAVYGHESLEYTVERHLDAFPHTKKASIVFLGIKKGSEALSGIFDSLEKSLTLYGLEKEKRRFHPHITAARIKKPIDVTAVTGLPFSCNEKTYRIGHVSVYESILERQGARYIIIERFVLK